MADGLSFPEGKTAIYENGLCVSGVEGRTLHVPGIGHFYLAHRSHLESRVAQAR